MNLSKILVTIVLFSFLQGSLSAQKNGTAETIVNRVYKYNVGSQEKPSYMGAAEFELTSPFRIRQGIDYPEMYEYYYLDSLWNIPQCQGNIRIDTCHGKNVIITYILLNQQDSITLEFFEKNKMTESKTFKLEEDRFPEPSSFSAINEMIKHPIKASHHLKEYQGLNYFSIYQKDSVNNNQIAKTGILDIQGDSLVFDTINIGNLSAIDISSTVWAARGYTKPRKYGVTAIYYGKTDSLKFEETWSIYEIENISVRELFIVNNKIYLLTNKGVSILANDTIVTDPSFKYNLENKTNSVFYGLFEYDKKPAVIFNKNILVLTQNEWQSIYTFKSKYKYGSTAVSFGRDSIYFVADRKLWFTDLDTTIQVGKKIHDIMRIAKGPNNTILYKQGNINNCFFGGIYFIDSKLNLPLKREYISKHPDLIVNDIFYMNSINRIVATNFSGVFEFELKEWMKKKDDNK